MITRRRLLSLLPACMLPSTPEPEPDSPPPLHVMTVLPEDARMVSASQSRHKVISDDTFEPTHIKTTETLTYYQPIPRGERA